MRSCSSSPMMTTHAGDPSALISAAWKKFQALRKQVLGLEAAVGLDVAAWMVMNLSDQDECRALIESQWTDGEDCGSQLNWLCATAQAAAMMGRSEHLSAAFQGSEAKLGSLLASLARGDVGCMGDLATALKGVRPRLTAVIKAPIQMPICDADEDDAHHAACA